MGIGLRDHVTALALHQGDCPWLEVLSVNLMELVSP
jgi:hypothetical protein